MSLLLILKSNYDYKYYKFIFLLIWEFFSSVLAHGFPLKFEWQQVSKFPQVFSTFLSILNDAVLWMVSTQTLISKSLVLVPILWWLYRARQLQLASPSLSCSIVISVLWQVLGTYLSFRFPSVLPCGQLERQSFRDLGFSYTKSSYCQISTSCKIPCGLPYPPSRALSYTLFSNFLHSLIMWLIVSSLSPHNLHLLFCCVLSIIALT